MELDSFVDNYTGVKASVEERFMTKATIALVKEHCEGKKVLTLGLGNGLVASAVAEVAATQVVVEGSPRIVDLFSRKLPNTQVTTSFFETIDFDQRFDIILANHVLEHIDEPVNILKNILKPLLNLHGEIFITVPNAHSVHRQIGVELGMLNAVTDLNASDIGAGHKRVYSVAKLKRHLKQAGLSIIEMGGYNLKIVSLAQMQSWEDDLLDAIFTVSQRLPVELCANIWVRAKL